MSIKSINTVTGLLDRNGNYHSDLNAIPEDLKDSSRQMSAGTYRFNDFAELKEHLDIWEAKEDGVLYLYSIYRIDDVNEPYWYMRGFRYEENHDTMKEQTVPQTLPKWVFDECPSKEDVADDQLVHAVRKVDSTLASFFVDKPIFRFPELIYGRNLRTYWHIDKYIAYIKW